MCGQHCINPIHLTLSREIATVRNPATLHYLTTPSLRFIVQMEGLIRVVSHTHGIY